MKIDAEQLDRIEESIILLKDNEHFKNYFNAIVDLREKLITDAYSNKDIYPHPELVSANMTAVGVLDSIIEPIRDLYEDSV